MKHYYQIAAKAIRDHSVQDISREKLLHALPINPTTRNRLLRDARLADLNKRYAAELDRIVNHQSDMDMHYSNKVWIFWRQGFDSAPRMVKACVHSVKENLQNADIQLLSDANLTDYIQLPDHITEKREKKIIKEAQFSDIVRVSLLAEYGGLWLDSTAFCTGSRMFELFRDIPLFFYQNVDLDRESEQTIPASNWLISAYSHHPVLCALRDLCCKYWEKENYLRDYYLFHLLLHMVKDRYPEIWNAMPVYSEVPPHILQFEQWNPFNKNRFDEIRKMSDFHKLSWHDEFQLPENRKLAGSYYDMIVNQRI